MNKAIAGPESGKRKRRSWRRSSRTASSSSRPGVGAAVGMMTIDGAVMANSGRDGGALAHGGGAQKTAPAESAAATAAAASTRTPARSSDVGRRNGSGIGSGAVNGAKQRRGGALPDRSIPDVTIIVDNGGVTSTKLDEAMDCSWRIFSHICFEDVALAYIGEEETDGVRCVRALHSLQVSEEPSSSRRSQALQSKIGVWPWAGMALGGHETSNAEAANDQQRSGTESGQRAMRCAAEPRTASSSGRPGVGAAVGMMTSGGAAVGNGGLDGGALAHGGGAQTATPTESAAATAAAASIRMPARSSDAGEEERQRHRHRHRHRHRQRRGERCGPMARYRTDRSPTRQQQWTMEA
ncbi:hypothetical protein Scep_001685 [Stephania cephalantha]|uniref:Uncharacterized protein n=1 Tax=Stephania cephalantha TaxID=152367 RepID=A0AAP0Q599_9MAGN